MATWRPSLATPLGVTLTVLADLVALWLAFEAARRLRLAFGGVIFAPLDAAALDPLIPPIWMVMVVWLGSAWWARLYRPRRGLWWPNAVIQVVESMVMATALTVVLSFAIYGDRTPGLSRAFLVLLLASGVVFALTLRAGIWATGRAVRVGRPLNVLVVGSGEDTQEVLSQLFAAGPARVSVRGLVSTTVPVEAKTPIPVVGTMRDLRRCINQTRADRVVVIDTNLPLDVLAECVDVCASMHVPLNCTGGGLTRAATVVDVGELAGMSLLEVRRPEFERTQDVLKRATDLGVAGTLLLITLPIWAGLALAIRLTSPGPILFVADRVGRGGRHFSCLKFRSMVASSDDLDARRVLDGHVFKSPNDARVTPVGRFMRRFSLDELPQLWNILVGDMSLIGPRPLPALDLDPDGLSERYRTWSIERSTVRPGLTGLWQVRGRSQLPFEEMVRLDLLYVRTRSYQLDLQILLETIPAVVVGRGAV